MELRADIAIVGAGASGLSLAYRLCGVAGAPAALDGGGRPGPDTGPGDGPGTGSGSGSGSGSATGPDIVLLDAPPGPVRSPERTWCFWEPRRGEFDGALSASWDRLRVTGPGGRVAERALGPLRYKMLRSGPFTELVGARLDSYPGLRRAEAHVWEVTDTSDGAEVRGTAADGTPVRVRARWVFDSRPPTALPPARTTLLQHFKGWFIRTGSTALNPVAADLMDFRTRQPDSGLSFGYVLPWNAREALVEYTEFAPRTCDDAAYDRALRHYVEDVLGLTEYEVTATERGVIPMTDGHFAPRAGASVFRIGVAGGATRPSTGYTFSAIQRQTRQIAHAWQRGRTPVPRPVYPRRALAMDAVLLRALDTGRLDGAAFFTGLFERVPVRRLLRFLDGDTRFAEELAVGLRTPVRPMLRTLLELPALRQQTSSYGSSRSSPYGSPCGQHSEHLPPSEHSPHSQQLPYRP